MPINVAKVNVAISESSSLSTPSSSLAQKHVQSLRENLSKRSESINSIESKSSHKSSTKVPSKNKDNTPTVRTQPPPFVDLFAEPPEDVQSTTSSSVSSTHNVKNFTDEYQKPEQSQNKTKITERPSILRSHPAPFVDLFAEPPADLPPSTTSSSVSSGLNTKRKTVNLFDDDKLDDVKQNDLLADFNKQPELLTTKTNEIKSLTLEKTAADDKPFKISKSLFEDSDEDDFLKEFVNKQPIKTAQKSTLTKTLLFDNDLSDSSNVFTPDLKNKKIDGDNLPPNDSNAEPEIAFPAVEESISSSKARNKINLFGGSDDKLDDLLFSKNDKQQVANVVQNKIRENEHNERKITNQGDSVASSSKERTKITNLFDSVEANEDDLLFDRKIKEVSTNAVQSSEKETDSNVIKNLTKESENVKNSPNFVHNFEQKIEVTNSKSDKFIENSKKFNIFDDIYDEDEDNLFSTKPKPKQAISNENVLKSSAVEDGIKDTNYKKLENTNNKAVVAPKKDVEGENDTKSSENTLNKPVIAPRKDIVEKNVTKSLENIIHKPVIVTKKDFVEESTMKTSTNSECLTEVPKESEYHEEAAPKTPTYSDVPKEEVSEIPLEVEKKLSSNEDSPKSQSISLCDNDKNNSQCELDNKPSTSASKYEFNSVLFMDEPPEDDSEFFESLTKTPQISHANYNIIDLENDLYEPELPKVPAVETNNVAINPDNRQGAAYTGLQLFSDIPPDDDNNYDNVGQSKKLQGIFYDDLNETMEALNISGMSKTPSILSNEPATITCELNVDSDKTTINSDIENVPRETTNKVSKLKDAIEFPKDVKEKSEDKDDSISSGIRPVSKLLMPNININVQALLPGANSTLRKNKDENTKSWEDDKNEIVFPVTKVSLDDKVNDDSISVAKEKTPAYSRTAETEHILSSMTKTRVRAPATRRPSTRRARQENYQKSLIEEQKSSENSNAFHSLEVSGNSTIAKTNDNEQLFSTDSKQPLASVFPDLNAANVPKTGIIPTEDKSNEIPKKLESSQRTNDEEKNKKSNFLKLFEDKEENDDLFSNIMTPKSTKREEKSKIAVEEKVPDKISSQVIDTNSAIQNIVNPDVTKQAALSVTAEETGKEKSDNFREISPLSPTKIENTKIEHLNPTSTTIVTSSSFFDDDDDMDDDLFKPTVHKINNRAKQQAISQAKAQFKSFLDNESDEEHDEVKQQTNTSTQTVTNTSNPSGNKVKHATIENSKQLFADSDTDSDDLFGKLSKTKAVNVIKASEKFSIKPTTPISKDPPKTSLFSDESDNDDFLKTAEISIKKTETKRFETENKTKVGAQTSSSLFSDIDSDEDDLFGSSTAVKSTTAGKYC